VKAFVLTIAAMAGLTAAAPACAQDKYPNKAIELIVPFAAGASTDSGARIIAQALEARWKVPVKVVNKPGGNTVPAVNDVMTAKPDGAVLLVDGPPQSSMLDTVVKNLAFKVTDRTFVAIMAYTPMIFIVPYDSPLQTLKDIASELQKTPGDFTWTSLGGAGAQDMAFRQLFAAANVDAKKTRSVALKGGSEAVTMTAGGHVKLGVGSYGAIAAPLAAKKIRVIATASPERWPNLKDTPTAAEAGFPSVETLYWIGISGPPNLPANIVQTWDEALREVVADKAVQEKLLHAGLLGSYFNAKDMSARIVKERAETQQLFGN
jgi:tripartite-type tricarboxylate transporter receptor subunit TctC